MARWGWLVARIAPATALALGACGGGGAPAASAPGSGSAPSVVVTTRSAVVSADLDGDGLRDLASLPRDGSGPGLCWRNVGAGDFAPVASAPAVSALPALHAIVDDGEACDDAQLTDGFAVRRVRGALGRGAPTYAVLHLGDGATAAVDGPPVVDSVEPAAAPSRALVVIEGSALASRGATTSVTFGTATATVLYAFPDAVFAIVPDGMAEGPTEVRVARGDATSAPAPFTVVSRATPVVTSVVPSTVVAGTVAILRGEHLGTPLEPVEVAFAGAAPTRAIGLGRVAAVVVPDAAVSGPATITVSGVVSLPFSVIVGTLPTPEIASLSPTSASIGSLVRVTGTDLFAVGETAGVTFGGVAAAFFALDAQSLTVIVPPGAADGDVVVTVGGRASAGEPFAVLARGPPVVVAIDPVAAAIGDVVEVRGTDLVDLSAWRPSRLPPLPPLGDLKVTLGGRVAWFVLPSESGLRVVVPPGAVSGSLVVAVDGVASSAFPFDVK